MSSRRETQKEIMTIQNDREYWIDAIRSFACLCVITTHAPMPNGSDGSSFIAIFNYYSVAGASILFFMISGALVLYKEKEVLPFLKKRISRIALPMFIWSVISLLLRQLMGEFPKEEIFEKICWIPIWAQKMLGVYWFIYAIFGIYLVTPILAMWLNRSKERDILFYLSLWAITLFLPYLACLDCRFEKLIASKTGVLYYFYGFLGFAVLGFYLRRYVNIKQYKYKHVALLLALIILPWSLYYFTEIPHSVIQNRMSVNVVAMCVCYFVIIKHIHLSSLAKKIVYNFAQHSFGIYLVHILIMKKLLYPLFWNYNIHYAIQIPLIVFLTALLSYLLVHLISKLPYSKYIVGL